MRHELTLVALEIRAHHSGRIMVTARSAAGTATTMMVDNLEAAAGVLADAAMTVLRTMRAALPASDGDSSG